MSVSLPHRARSQAPGALRRWQSRAMARYAARAPKDFLAVATPGAGKTTFALAIARTLLDDGTVDAITVVTPTEHLKGQWASAGAAFGIDLDPAYKNADGLKVAKGLIGAVVTYAQVAAAPEVHRLRTEGRPTMVILDEIHHGGDALSWGDGIRVAFEPAVRRLSLTGTPFRSDTAPIPFVTYEQDADGVRRSMADSSYGYADALRDGVVRPVLFLAYSGEASWRTSAGDVVSAQLDDLLTADATARAWRTALDPKGDWVPTVLAAADRRLTEVRAAGMPDAGGLVIASDQTAARAYAAILKDITGKAPVVALSDEKAASKRIRAFAEGDARWLVAVRMVSEGVDIPRLAVGVYATSASTPLFFAQAIGRFVRARRPGESASVFLPSVRPLLTLAAEMEKERDHALDRFRADDDVFGAEDDLLRAANREQDTADELGSFEALGASAHLASVVLNSTEVGVLALPGSPEEEDYLGLPGLLDPTQVSTLLTAKRAQRTSAAAPAAPTTTPTWQRRAELRGELNTLVRAWHARTQTPHAQVHAELRRVCGGPAVAQATVEELEARIAALRAWAVASRPGA
ncbi:MAG TPA: DEAD/DEAH box helicase [Mycobacteriales bacterium]|nr:DEAD/DEAH box helicase [Mycobacteriales bacterium]